MSENDDFDVSLSLSEMSTAEMVIEGFKDLKTAMCEDNSMEGTKKLNLAELFLKVLKIMKRLFQQESADTISLLLEMVMKYYNMQSYIKAKESSANVADLLLPYQSNKNKDEQFTSHSSTQTDDYIVKKDAKWVNTFCDVQGGIVEDLSTKLNVQPVFSSLTVTSSADTDVSNISDDVQSAIIKKGTVLESSFQKEPNRALSMYARGTKLNDRLLKGEVFIPHSSLKEQLPRFSLKKDDVAGGLKRKRKTQPERSAKVKVQRTISLTAKSKTNVFEDFISESDSEAIQEPSNKDEPISSLGHTIPQKPNDDFPCTKPWPNKGSFGKCKWCIVEDFELIKDRLKAIVPKAYNTLVCKVKAKSASSFEVVLAINAKTTVDCESWIDKFQATSMMSFSIPEHFRTNQKKPLNGVLFMQKRHYEYGFWPTKYEKIRPTNCNSEITLTLHDKDILNGDMNSHLLNHPFQVVLTWKHDYITKESATSSNKPSGFEKNKFICKICQQFFTGSAEYKDHLFTHSGEKPNKCQICPLSFFKLETLTEHYNRYHGGMKYSCNQCWKHYETEQAMNEHILYCHHESRLCDVCGASFFNKDLYKEHCLTHFGRAVKCNVCQKGFYSINSLQHHMDAVHLKEKCVCQICGDVVKCLKNHMFIMHTDIKPFKCKDCSCTFKQSGALKRHVCKHKKAPKLFNCDLCQSGFSRMRALKVHYRIHTGEKPYKCDVCGECFAFGHEQQKHNEVVHTGKDFFKCDRCDKSFPTRLGAKVHKGQNSCRYIQKDNDNSFDQTRLQKSMGKPIISGELSSKISQEVHLNMT